MSFLTFYLAISAGFVGLARCCQVFEAQKEIDWQAMKAVGAWYEALHTNDAVMEDDVACSKLENFTETSDGISFDVREYHRAAVPPSSYPIYVTQRGKALYQHRPNVNGPMIASQIIGEDGRTNSKALDVANVIAEEVSLYLTDERNYLANIWCTEAGSWIVWANFPSPTPSGDQVLALFNAMIDAGVVTKLHPCEAVDFTK